MNTIEFADVSGFVTLQDRGRIGFANIAVPTSGAFDQSSQQLANRLVGNHPDTCVIESLRARFTFSTDADLVIAVTGAPVSLRVNGREHEIGRPVFAPESAVVEVAPGVAGMRTYLAFRGGIEGTQVMGSCSYDELSRIGTKPLQSGNRFVIQNKASAPASGDSAPTTLILSSGELELEAMPAPRWDGFSNAQTLFTNDYLVTDSINRVGLRLSGPPLAWTSTKRLASEGVVIGAIQIPADGMPLIFGPDHPTTGGYPVVAVVSRKGLDKLAQARPGSKVRFNRSR